MVTRRRALASLMATGGLAATRQPARLERFFEASQGAAILLDVRSRRLVGVHAPDAARKFLAPPGSTLKPFVLAALLRNGRITEGESLVCTGRLRIGSRSLDCVHPRLDAPVRIDTALAYSCNNFAAHVAERFAGGELARELVRAGFHAARPAMDLDSTRLQALGEDRILVTAAELASAYRWLALNCPPQILAGVEGAVEFGTAQRAQVPDIKVAGKTGSTRTAEGASIAWFAGWMPSRTPETVVAVMMQGRSGGSDAAPLAGRILAAYRAGRI